MNVGAQLCTWSLAIDASKRVRWLVVGGAGRQGCLRTAIDFAGRIDY